MRKDRSEELEKFHAQNENAWLRRRRESIPVAIRDRTTTIAKAALTIKKGNHRNSPSDSEYRAIGKEIEGLSDAERLALFETIFPKLAPALDRAWRNLPRRAAFIETDDYFSARVPFRAGSAKRHLTFTRGVWFADVVGRLIGYDADPEWLAAWITHMHAYDCHVAAVLAGAIDIGDPTSDRLFEILKASATNTHPIGEMSIDVIAALLMSERTEAWDFVADLVLNGEREEGLRQAILESIHECHPDAFVRFLHLIMEERLVRFSSVVRAADVWFGLRLDSIGPAVIQKQVERAHLFLTDDRARDKALASGSGEEAYMALWCLAFRDLGAAAKRAAELVKDADPERRFASVAIAQLACAPEFLPVMLAALEDSDERVVAGGVRAVDRAAPIAASDSFKTEALFDALAAVFDRVAAGKPKKLAPIIWPWTAETLSTAFVGGPLVRVAPASRKDELVPRLEKLGPRERREVALGIGMAQSLRQAAESKQGKPGPLKPEAQAALIALLGDAAAEAREAAFKVLSPHPLTPAERDRIEDLLARKASDIRSKGIERLLTQSDEDALASASRLLEAASVEQHLAGAEILTQMAGMKRSVERVATEATRASDALAGSTKNRKPDARVESLLATARKADIEVPTLRDCLGLVPPERALIPPDSVPKPRAFEPLMMTLEAIELLMSLDDLVSKNKDLPIAGTKDLDDPSEARVLGSVWSIWDPPKRQDDDDEDYDSDATEADGLLGKIAHEDLWSQWWDSQRSTLGKTARRTLLLARLAMDVLGHLGYEYEHAKWPKGFQTLAPKGRPRPPKYDVVKDIIYWLLAREGTDADAALMLDQAERALAHGRIIDLHDEDDDHKRGPDPREPLTPELSMPFSWWRHMWYLPVMRLDDSARAALECRVFRLHRVADAFWPDYYAKVVREAVERMRAKHAKSGYYSSSWDSDFNLPAPSVRSLVSAIRAGEADEVDVIRYAIHAHEDEKWGDRVFGYWNSRALKPLLSGRTDVRL
jgi:hypothetical protein